MAERLRGDPVSDQQVLDGLVNALRQNAIVQGDAPRVGVPLVKLAVTLADYQTSQVVEGHFITCEIDEDGKRLADKPVTIEVYEDKVDVVEKLGHNDRTRAALEHAKQSFALKEQEFYEEVAASQGTTVAQLDKSKHLQPWSLAAEYFAQNRKDLPPFASVKRISDAPQQGNKRAA